MTLESVSVESRRKKKMVKVQLQVINKGVLAEFGHDATGYLVFN